MSKTGDPTLQTTHLQTMRRVRNAVTVTATEIAPLAAIGVMERGEPTAGGWRLRRGRRRAGVAPRTYNAKPNR